MSRCRLSIGRRLRAGEASPTGLYALVSRRGTLLRVSCIQGFAEEMTDPESRYLHACGIELLPEKTH